MKPQKNLRDTYIQLVETFITALESGKSGADLEGIRKEIRIISSQLDNVVSVENSTQQQSLNSFQQNDNMSNERDTTVSS